jgi:hypothetical protein
MPATIGLTKTFNADSPTGIVKNNIMAVSGVHAGNVLLSTAGLLGFVGVSLETPDAKGELAVQISGIAQITADADGVTAGNLIASSAAGLADAVTPNATADSGTLTQIVGVALNTAAAGTLVDVLIQPSIAYV